MTPKSNESKQDFLKRCTRQAAGGGTSDEAAYKTCNLAWDNARSQRAALNLSQPVVFAAGDDQTAAGAGAFMITAYTGKPMATWWNDVVIDLTGIETKEKIPVLREHARDRVVGYGTASSDDNHFYVAGTFSKNTQDAFEVKALADEGYPWQASISVQAAKVVLLEDEKQTATVNGREVSGPMEIWRQSRVGEVSFVTLGRDDDTAAISLAGDTEPHKHPVAIETAAAAASFYPTTQLTEGEHPMPEKIAFTIELLTKEAPELLKKIKDEAFAAGIEAGRADGVADERARVVEILTAGASDDATRRAIVDGIDAAAAYKLFYQAEVQARADGLLNLEKEAPPALATPDPAGVVPAAVKDVKQIRAEWRPLIGPAAA